MKTLTEFLNEHAEKYESNEEQRIARRDEEFQSVERLINQLQEWVVQADQRRVLEVSIERRTIREESIGKYTVPCLVIGLGTLEVRVVPIARFVVASMEVDGKRVDFQGFVRITDGGLYFSIYRLVDQRGERWFLAHEGRVRQFEELNRASFESTLQRLFE